MRSILKLRWLVLALWLIAAAGLMLIAPNMADLVREKGQITVPESYSSSIAEEMLANMSQESGGASTVLVFHDEQGLQETEMAEIKQAAQKLRSSGEAAGIKTVTTHFDNEELAEQMVSKDGSTVLVLVNASLEGRTASEVSRALYGLLSDVTVDHYYTGNWIIMEDVIQSSQDGLKKTEWITVVFILIILLLVFRSPVAPFVPLLTIGISYVVSQSVVAFLVHYFNFPLSNFTQIFMVAILFGIGTDYCILLISRYKEELAHSEDRYEAIVKTYRTAGKTVLFSGLAVLVGFTSIGFSEFSLYRSAVAVAVAVFVMMIALVTLVPFFMAVLGKALFWPAKGSLEHKQSKIWGSVGQFSLKRPLWTLLLLAAVTVPFLAAYQGSISYNSLDEIGDKYDSVKGFNLIADRFGPGETLPSTAVVQSSKPLDTPEGLAFVETISRELAKTDGVKTVRSATRPTGEPIQDLQVADQATVLGEGLLEGAEGLDEISTGLSDASSALSENAPKLQEAAQGVDQLIGGTEELKNGIQQLGDGLKQLQTGLAAGTAGASELKQGLQQAKASADQLSTASGQLLTSYSQIGAGLGELHKAYSQIAEQHAALTGGLKSIEQGLGGLAVKYPELAADTDYLRLQGAVTELSQGAAQLQSGLSQLNTQFAGVQAGMQQANDGLKQASSGQSALAAGLSQLADGIAELQSGISRAAEGQGQIVARVPEMTEGIDQLTNGQRQLKTGFTDLDSQLAQLTDGLNQSVDGLNQVSDGLKSAESYLSALSDEQQSALSGWHIPQEAIESDDFQTVLDVYMSDDRKSVKFDVVFTGNPYETETMDRIPELENALQRALKNSGYEDSSFAIGGVSSSNNDLRNISNADYTRTAALMLIGIGIILIVLFRSIVMPIYLILSLLLTYFTSMAITEVIFVRILDISGISWAVPFFGFVMLMALGIDYSIFLMDRFKEYRHLSPQEGILLAMKNMGTVIMSAALILGGTFAAMLPAGVMSLMQIATIVLCGLFLYALVMLPLFVPVMVRTFGEANWWPFMKKEN